MNAKITDFFKNFTNKDNKHLFKKTVSLFVCVLVISVFLLSSAYIFANANHKHNHNGFDGACTTCVNLVSAQNQLKQTATPVSGGFTAVLVCVIFFILLKKITGTSDFSTPISLKVRLNN
jgi:F0F1-type ATP synthase membrane subunit a